MRPRFLVDSMLGSLSRWLRITGFDAEYRRDAADEDLIDEAIATGRVLLTRDKVLAARAAKRGVQVVLVEGEHDVEQLGMVASALSLELEVSESRCPKCNGCLERAEKSMLTDQVPEASLNAFDEFWVCRECGSVFWRGSHWDQIRSTLEKAERMGSTG
ncbi:MAG: Mut7-C RNAse domain-containing protein [Candidatus Bathyarchaeota archaeon]